MYKTIMIAGEKFITKNAALMAFQQVQLYFAQAGYLTTSRLRVNDNQMSVTVYYELPDFPRLPAGYLCSGKELSTQTYFYEDKQKPGYIRTVTYYFKY